MMTQTHTFIGFAKDEIERSIAHRFRYVVNRFPDHIAIQSDRHQLTYTEFHHNANQIAHAILRQRGQGEEPIALLLEHDAAMMTAMLGTLISGKAYVALDPSYPQFRLSQILSDLQGELILTNSQNLALAQELVSTQTTYQILNIDELDTEISDEVDVPINGDTLAGIFYTSGSTGKAKGVARPHREILHRIWLETNDYKIHTGDKISLLYSCSFGASISDIFNALLNGATLCLYNVKGAGLDTLVNWLTHEGITIFHLPVMLFQQLLDWLTGEETFPKLRQIIPSGKLFRRDVERFRRYFPEDCILIQRLSSTETGMIRRFIIDRHTEINSPVVPVGYAIEDKEVYLVDETGQPVDINEVGEIVVKSRYLSAGYWRNPELTRQKFLPSPTGDGTQIYFTRDLGRLRPDGCLEFLGRKDFMLKIRGYRVEPSEIEVALLELGSIKQAVVVAQPDANGEQQLVAYFIPQAEPAPSTTRLRRALTQTLPDYMVPLVFVALTEMPLTASGKIDRAGLPPVDWTQRHLDTSLVAPTTSLEEKLTVIWRTLLKLEQVGIHDNFFDLGGHSLLAVQLLSDIKQQLGYDLPVATLLQAPTIAELAVLLEQGTRSPWMALVPVQPNGTKPSLFFHGGAADALKWSGVARLLGSDQPFYAFQRPDLDGKPVTQTTVEALAAHCIEEMRTVQPHGPYFIGGHCFGGVVAFEIAHQLLAQGEAIALFVLIDSYAPKPLPTSSWFRLQNSVHKTLFELQKSYYYHGNLRGLRQLPERINTVLKRKLQQRDRQTVLTETSNPQPETKQHRAEASSAPHLTTNLGETLSHEMRYIRAEAINRTAKAQYRPKVYPGSIVLLRATRQVRAWHFGSALGWHDLTSQAIDTIQIPGFFGNLFNYKALPKVASALKQVLETAQNNSASGASSD
ncbi:alpha/beta fold hydrolase [Oscillatoria sp. FACHB-1407]|uniref:alpha/beta fold hydrolase n=1 Tax=Oscillatoria sp. FACHB-1407 TaxID=2692847 RepID=UPI001684C731|nr:alpha/beta fold hydrolase [Oscillatoria sp. FACHB-1407]MBD2461873.1 alpha/beta fold hydrolase [Oscillatoria sp. FACHB-1407]